RQHTKCLSDWSSDVCSSDLKEATALQETSGIYPPIRALIFDMDGLLVDSEPLAEAAMTAFLRRYGQEPRSEVAAQVLGRRLPEEIGRASCREGVWRWGAGGG